MQSPGCSAQPQPAADRTDVLTAELWYMIFEHLRMLNGPERAGRITHYQGDGTMAPWYPARLDSVPLYLRLISRRLGAIATPLAFSVFAIHNKFFLPRYEDARVAAQVKSLVCTYAQRILISFGVPWEPASLFLIKCVALKDLVWLDWSTRPGPIRSDANKFFEQQLPCVRHHVRTLTAGLSAMHFIPTPNIVSAFVEYLDCSLFDEQVALRNLLLEGRQLKSLYLDGREVYITVETEQLRPLRELVIRTENYTSTGNPRLWDFSDLRHLNIRLHGIQAMLQEVPVMDMPRISILTLVYPSTYKRERRWEETSHQWNQAVQDFLETRSMPQLEEVRICCYRPLSFVPALVNSAPCLKRLMLGDMAPPQMPQKCTPGHVRALLESCPALEVLDIEISCSLLWLDDEDMYKTTFCLFKQLRGLRIVFIMPFSSYPHEATRSLRLRDLGHMLRVKEYIVRWKVGAPLQQLVVKVRTGNQSLNRVQTDTHNYTWNSEGEEHYDMHTGLHGTLERTEALWDTYDWLY